MALGTVRRRLYRQLEPSQWDGPGLSPANLAILMLVFTSVGLAILGTERSLRGDITEIEVYSGWFFFFVFLAELLLRAWAAGEEELYRGPIGKIRFLLRPSSIIDIVAIFSFLAPIIGIDGFILRLIRILRIIALGKIGRYSNALKSVAEAVSSRKYELSMSLFFALILLIISATAMYMIEGPRQPDKFGSIPRALWWAVATLTTVGYGDVYPVTTIGKVIAGITAVMSIGLIALPAGILASAFSDAVQKAKRTGGSRSAADGTTSPTTEARGFGEEGGAS